MADIETRKRIGMATGQSKNRWTESSLDFSAATSDIRIEYDGKKSVADILSTSPSHISQLWGDCAQNSLYYGNNLPILSHLLYNDDIRGKVRLIYIDPPFATNSIFQSRNQKDAYQDLLTGSRYIEFIRQRLILLRELLSEDGSIYVHLDENMAFYVKVIMDEIFGKSNFKNWITRRKSSHKNYTRKQFGNISDYILFYTKSNTYVWNRPIESWTDKRAEKEYTQIEEGTGRRYKKVPIHAPGIRNGATGGPWRGMLPPPGKHWQYAPDKLDEMDARGEIYWSANGNPRRKIYLDASEGVPIQDIWYEFRDAQNQNARITGYPTEKNPAMLALIIGASSNPGDLVLDCFAGSGTTLVEAHKLGRRWLGVDNSPEALTTMLRRFAFGATPMGDFVKKPSQHPVAHNLTLDFGDQSPINAFAEPLIRDFTLYAAEPVGPEAHTATAQWQEWIVME